LSKARKALSKNRDAFIELKRRKERKERKYGLVKSEKVVVTSKSRKKKKRDNETKILWVSRHKLSREQKMALTRIYGRYRVIQHPNTVADYKEVLELGKHCDVLAVNISLEIKNDLVKNAGKPVIQSTSKRTTSMSNYVHAVVYNGWEQLMYIRYEAKKVTKYHHSERPVKIFYLGNKLLLPEQREELRNIYGSSFNLVQCFDKNKEVRQVLKIAEDFDVIILDHNLSTTKYLLKATDKPVLHPRYMRIDTDRLAYNANSGRMEPEVINIPDGFNVVKELDYATKKL